MGIPELLDELRKRALQDQALLEKLLDSRNDDNPIVSFCRICREQGYPIYEMELMSAGEEFYSEMKRSTNGGGENSPVLEGEDDFYEMFFASLEQASGHREKKIAVIFPGLGYTCGKPLLYYTASLAKDNGYEIKKLDYGKAVHSFKGREEKDVLGLLDRAMGHVEKELRGIRWENYGGILFISKSIGTVLACRAEEMLGLRAKHLLLTPIPPAFPYLDKIDGCFVGGTNDPYVEKELILAAAKQHPDKVGAILEDCDHSLEKKGDTFGNIHKLEEVLECLQCLIK